MTDTPRNRLPLLAALITGYLSALTAFAPAFADERWKLPPPAPVFDEADGPRERASNRFESNRYDNDGRTAEFQTGDANTDGSNNGTLAPSTSEPSVARNDFWMVSSYRCRQSCSKCCVCGQLDYLYSDGCQMYPSDQQSFQQSLQPGAPVCIVVHGSFVEADMLSEILTGGTIKDAETLISENRPMFHWIRGAAPDRPLNVVFYAWPSDAPITYLPQADVAILGRRSSFNALYLADLIDSISPDHPICLVGHSHGARMVAAALHLLAGGEVQGHRLCHPPVNCNRIRTVLIAGALDHHWLVPGQRYGRALYRTEALVNVKNDHDIALNIYPFRRPFSHRAIGESGVTNRDRRALGGLNGRLAEMDVTPIIGHGHLTKHYTHHPEIACALRPYIYFDDAYATTAARSDDDMIRQTAADENGALRSPLNSRQCSERGNTAEPFRARDFSHGQPVHDSSKTTNQRS